MMPSPYGHQHRKDRAETLVRDCYECVRCGLGDRAKGLRSYLELAHLDGDAWNREPENRAILCALCHKAVDHAAWAAKFRAFLVRRREQRLDELDGARPILAALREPPSAMVAAGSAADLAAGSSVAAEAGELQ